MKRTVILGVLLFGALLPVLTGCGAQQQLPYSLAPEEALADHIHDAPERVRMSYRFAVENQEELAKYPCYCGCGAMGHTSNLSCYILDTREDGSIVYDYHALGCGICVDITMDVMRMLGEGRSSPEIRAYVDATYSSFGPGTNTPLPVQ